MPTFPNIVEITGAGNQALKLDSTDVLPNGQQKSNVLLEAVTSNGITESQLQFNGKFTLAAPPAGLGNPVPLMTVRQQGGKVAIGPYGLEGQALEQFTVSGTGNQGIALVCTDEKGNPAPSGSRCDLMAVVNNPGKPNGEAQLQFKGEFTFAAPPAAVDNPVRLMTIKDDGIILIKGADGNLYSLQDTLQSLQAEIADLSSQIAFLTK